MSDRPAFVLHDHRRPSPHHDLRLEQDGVLRSWAVPKGLPTSSDQDRLAVAVDDHDLDHLTYEDEHKSVAEHGLCFGTAIALLTAAAFALQWVMHLLP